MQRHTFLNYSLTSTFSCPKCYFMRIFSPFLPPPLGTVVSMAHLSKQGTAEVLFLRRDFQSSLQMSMLQGVKHLVPCWSIYRLWSFSHFFTLRHQTLVSLGFNTKLCIILKCKKSETCFLILFSKNISCGFIFSPTESITVSKLDLDFGWVYKYALI